MIVPPLDLENVSVVYWEKENQVTIETDDGIVKLSIDDAIRISRWIISIAPLSLEETGGMSKV